MLRGFMDLVFRHNGKYYLVDYKSNFLGVEPQNYVGKSLEQAMLANHYDWQYLFYTVICNNVTQTINTKSILVACFIVSYAA